MPALSTTVVAPTGGWNTRDPLELMPESDAIDLVNIFPETTHVRVRKGFTTEQGTNGNSVPQSLMEFIGSDGTRRLLSAQGGGLTYASGGVVTQAKAAGTFTSNKWQHINFNNRLIFVNGVDQPQQFDGTTVSDATYTGISDDNSLVHVSAYKKRLYFIPSGSQSVWYGAVDEITGALTEENVSGNLRLGGALMYGGAVSADTGSGLADLFVLVSEAGELLVYQGSYPGDAGWSLAARFYIAPPVGRRAFTNYESDLLILTTEGVVSVARLLQQGQQAVKLTDKIQQAFADAYQSYSSNFGWQIQWFPLGHMLLINIPTADGVSSLQYVMNTLTGAWCKFEGINTSVLGLYQNNLVFAGVDGTIYRAESGYSDNGQDISWEIKSAFNYFSNRASIKHFKQLKPHLITDTNFTFRLGLDVDFKDNAITTTASAAGTGGEDWDDADWDSDSWDAGSSSPAKWWGVGNVGKCAAWKMSGDVNSYSFSLASIGVIYEPGGLF